MKMLVKRITHSSSLRISHPISLSLRSLCILLTVWLSLWRLKVSSSVHVWLFSLPVFVYPRVWMYLSLYQVSVSEGWRRVRCSCGGRKRVLKQHSGQQDRSTFCDLFHSLYSSIRLSFILWFWISRDCCVSSNIPRLNVNKSCLVSLMYPHDRNSIHSQLDAHVISEV